MKILSYIPEPDEFIFKKLKGIPQNIKIAFFASLIFSVVVHGHMFLSKYVNTDSILHSIFHQPRRWEVSLGRWFAPFVSFISGAYVVPWVIGIFAILYLVLSVTITISILEIKSKLFVIIATFLMVSFPSLAYYFGFDYMADIFTLALLFSAIAVYFTKKYKYGYLPGAAALTLSLATFQAFIGFSIGLSLILVIKYILNNDSGLKSFLLYISKFLIMGILGVGAYLVSVRVVTNVLGIQLDGYRGASTMGQIPIAQLPSIVLQSFIDFFRFFAVNDRFFYVSLPLFVLYLMIFVLIIYFLVRLIFYKKIYKNFTSLFALLFTLIVMPIGINVVEIMAPQGGACVRTVYQFVLVIIFAMVLCEECKEITKPISKWLVIAVVLLVASTYMQTTGTYYLKGHIYYERTFAFYNRVLSRIEEKDSFSSDTPVAFIGQGMYVSGYGPSPQNFPSIINDHGYWSQFIGIHNLTFTPQRESPHRFISDFLGVSLKVATVEQENYIRQTETFENMPAWPAGGSVAYIDGVIVVRLNP